MGLTVRELCSRLPAESISRGHSDNDTKTEDSVGWYALTVRHQHERQIERSLMHQGWETLVPVYRRTAQWSDRTKEVECPLFSGYVLCHFSLQERIGVLNTPGVGKIVGFGGLPAAVEEREIAQIRRVVASQLRVQPWPYLKAGDRIRVERGPLRGVEGTLLRVNDALRLVIRVDMLQRSLAVELDPDMIVPMTAPMKGPVSVQVNALRRSA
jgi:transcription antitermination factor NusG